LPIVDGSLRVLKGEFKMFLSVDRAWKDLMRRVEDRPNAIKSAITPGTLETLQQNNLTLNIIQKNLEVSIVKCKGKYAMLLQRRPL
jgi:hypothetical protein